MATVQIRVRGQVQGVGFRPFVWMLAQRFDIQGHVLNDSEGVLVQAAGPQIDAFIQALSSEAPPLAQIDAVEVSSCGEVPQADGFEIKPSQGQGAETRVAPDAATCSHCVADILSSDPRRHGYSFTNCTHCGPRFTILNALPYDRGQTTMAPFEMCSDCDAEYKDPADRRFHAQPVACAQCGPEIWFEDAKGDRREKPMDAAAQALVSGQVLAVKGLGGFHLCCDATNDAAIASLRSRKHRPSKPFALMGQEDDIKRYARPSKKEWQALRSADAPIVLIPAGAVGLPQGVAPGQTCLGWMLPYTPLHHLLLRAVGRPLVMTSGNLSGEPQVIENAEAREKLAAFVDGFLLHNRDIARRLDDSVMRFTAEGPMVLRHARGRAPRPIALPQGFEDAPEVLAFGGQMKAAICLLKRGSALLSHHLGDLDDALTWDEFTKADADYAGLFDHAPSVFACDLHPDFAASRHAIKRAKNAPLIEVQHHHAHLCSVMAENGWPREGGPVAGIVLDGLGLGDDGTIWGGEILLGTYCGFERVAHLPVSTLVGGDRAQLEPWRNALFRLDEAGLGSVADQLFDGFPRQLLRQAAAQGINAIPSSSAGRLFDAVAGVLGICSAAQTYEGEAAMQLEAIAHTDQPAYPFGEDLSPAPMFRALVHDLQNNVPTGEISGRFHAGLAQAFAVPARNLVRTGKAEAVALSGGCFQNARLLAEVLIHLDDVPVLIHNEIPANDGGLALGQAVSAAAKVLERR